MNKRIILVGPAASGKDFMKQKFRDRGFKIDCSYTTRPARDGEKYGVDYNFISEDEFTLRISQDEFFEYVKHGPFLYGTGKYEWNNCDVFIMETDGIAQISKEDRNDCFIIYLNPPKYIRYDRLMHTRNWSVKEILKRFEIDDKKFDQFIDYDIVIDTPEFG